MGSNVLCGEHPVISGVRGRARRGERVVIARGKPRSRPSPTSHCLPPRAHPPHSPHPPPGRVAVFGEEGHIFISMCRNRTRRRSSMVPPLPHTNTRTKQNENTPLSHLHTILTSHHHHLSPSDRHSIRALVLSTGTSLHPHFRTFPSQSTKQANSDLP
jgi:hypothetical protein